MSSNSDIQFLHNKIDRLNQQAWEVRVNDSPKALSLSEESIKLARSIQYSRGIAAAARSLGFCYVRLSKYDEAIPLLNEALTLFETLGDLNGQAVITEYFAVIKRNQGHFGEALELLFRAISLSQQTGAKEDEAIHHYQVGVTYKYLGDFEKALEALFKSNSMHGENKNRLYQSYSINVIGSIYFENNDYARALEYFREGLSIRKEFRDKLGEAGSLDNLAFTYLRLKDFPRAIEYCSQSLAISKETGDKRSEASALQHLAEIYAQTGEEEQAAKYSNESLQIRKATGDKKGEAEILLFLARINKSRDKKGEQKVIELLNGALKIAEEIKAMPLLSETRLALYNYYKQQDNFKEAVQQLEMHLRLEKELQKDAINQKMQNLEISRRAEETQKESEAMGRRNKQLTELNSKIEMQKQELEVTLAELKAAQAQLIQSEKMASLGELTAGIAHEIQNPLNFVNNFSEVSNELLEEMVTELKSDNKAEALDIASEVKSNLEKILHHGKRADNIVKGMLQHSRSSTGVKEPVDINELADEYFRLAYHGFRAKDKSFNVTMKKEYDETIGNISVIPQDIGRVILNLITNAFYAVAERKKNLPLSPPTGGEDAANSSDYEPVVTVSTTRTFSPSGDGGKIEIRVADNGPGIPKNILDKIFQPFFTTKPTGQGTGLGLSLSYDIVKAHGGEIKVNTAEGAGTEFIITLPLLQ